MSDTGFSVHGYTAEKFVKLEGKIRTILEVTGLEGKQLKSLTDIVVTELWNLFDSPEFSYQYEGEKGPDAKLVFPIEMLASSNEISDKDLLDHIFLGKDLSNR